MECFEENPEVDNNDVNKVEEECLSDFLLGQRQL